MKRPKQHLHEVGNLSCSHATARGGATGEARQRKSRGRDGAPAHVRKHDVHHAIKLVGRFVNRLGQTAAALRSQ